MMLNIKKLSGSTTKIFFGLNWIVFANYNLKLSDKNRIKTLSFAGDFFHV